MADKRQLLLELLGKDSTGPATKSAAKNIDDVADAADDATKATEKFGKATVVAGSGADKLGDNARQAARHVNQLDEEISNVERELVGLAASFATASTAAERLDISKAIRRTENDLRRLNKSKGLLSAIIPDPAEIAKLGQEAGAEAAKAIGKGLASTGGQVAATAGAPIGAALGASIGIAAAPTLASFLASTLSGAIGVGVIGAGVMAAVKGDKGLEEAGKTAGTRFVKGLQSAATGPLAGPVRESLGMLAAAGDRLNKDLGATFKSLADKVAPFTGKLILAAEAITGPLLAAARDSGPAMDALGDGLIFIAEGVGDFITALADGGPEAAANLRLIMGLLGDAIGYTGELLGWLNKVSSIPFATGPLEMLKKKYSETAANGKQLADTQVDLGNKMTAAEKAAKGESAALEVLSKELKAQVDPTFDLIRSQGKLADAQKAVNEALKEHGRKSPEYQQALRQAAEAALSLEAAAGKVAATSNGQMTPALKATLRAAGFTEKEIRDLGTQFRNAKRDGDKFAKKYQAAAHVSGVPGARKAVRGIIDDLQRFAHKWTATMTVHYKQFGKPYSQDGVNRNQVGGLSAGGWVDGPGTTTSDSVPKLLSKKEFVVRAAVATRPEVASWLEHLNNGRPVSAPGRAGAVPSGGGRAGGGGGHLTIDLRGADSAFGRFFLSFLRTNNGAAYTAFQTMQNA